MRNGRKTQPADDFIASARRALRRAAQKVRKENQRLGLPVFPMAGRQSGGETCMITEDVRKYAAEQGIAEEGELAKRTAEKAEKFVEKNSEVCVKA